MIRFTRFAGFTVVTTDSMRPTVLVELSPGSWSWLIAIIAIIVVAVVVPVVVILVLNHCHEIVNFGVELRVLFIYL